MFQLAAALCLVPVSQKLTGTFGDIHSKENLIIYIEMNLSLKCVANTEAY